MIAPAYSLGAQRELRVGDLARRPDARVGRGPEVRLVVERVEERAGGVPARAGEGRLEPGHELVLVDDAVAGVGRVGQAPALRGTRLEEARVQVVRGLVDVAGRRLVGGDVAGHGDGHDHRGSGRVRRGHVRTDGFAGNVAATEVVVVLVVKVGAGVRSVRLPVVSRPAVAPEARQAEAARAARPARLVHPVDVGRDRVARRRRVDREPDDAGRRGRGGGRGGRGGGTGRPATPASRKERGNESEGGEAHAAIGHRRDATGRAARRRTAP